MTTEEEEEETKPAAAAAAPVAEKQREEEEEEDEDPQQQQQQPTTAVILLGEGLFLQPEAEVLCLSILKRSALSDCLATAAVADESLEALHLIVMANQVANVYDADCVAAIFPKLKPGADWTAHLLLDEHQRDVPADAVAAIRESFVLGGLRIVEAETLGPDGTRTVVGRKQPLLETAVLQEEEDEDGNYYEEEEAEADELAAALESKLRVKDEEEVIKLKEEKEEIDEAIIQRMAEWIRASKHVLVLTGAGVSVAAGIPDFRTPGTGLYDNLQKYNLPYAEAVFAIDYYTEVTPQPFVQLAADLWPSIGTGGPQPTLTHSFVALLHRKRRLLRNYSQNIDGLEHAAGIPPDRLVECHGHFRTASCTACRRPADIERVRASIVHDRQVPTCGRCGSYVKPDIVFFGEQLPPVFHQTLPRDLTQADLCLVLGTSLQVPPVARIPDLVRCKRVLINREPAGTIDSERRPDRDLFCGGDCDATVAKLAAALGWEEELRELHGTTTMTQVQTTKREEARAAMEQACSALQQAKENGWGLLVLTGAGMSVSSKVPVFRNSDGTMSDEFLNFLGQYNRARARHGLSEAADWFDFSVPEMFRRETAAEAWAYWRWRILRARVEPGRDYRDLARILRSFGDESKYFVVTSNCDGLHIARDGCAGADAATNLYEVHGSLSRVQCSAGCSDTLWPVDEAFVTRLREEPEWVPMCPECHEDCLRPNVMIFGDDKLEHSVLRKQQKNLNAFQEKNSSWIVLEIGAGVVVASIRHQAEELARKGGGGLIRINPSQDECKKMQTGNALAGEGKYWPIAAKSSDALESLAAALES